MKARTDTCNTDGCFKTRWRKDPGLCQACARKAGLYPELAECAEDGCTRKARSLGVGSRCRKHGGPAPKGTVQPGETSLCKARDCRYRAGEGGLCGKHRNASETARDRSRCVTPACVNVRSRAGGYCFVCYRRYGSTLNTCAHPLCQHKTVDEYCESHDVGLDYAAGDWFDWVAAERLFHGSHGSRKPTVPELLWVLAKADRVNLEYTVLAERIGIQHRLMASWRKTAARIEEARVAA